MRSQQIGFGENLAKRPRAAACLKPMRSKEQGVRIMRSEDLNAWQKAQELTNAPCATQALAAKVHALTKGLINSSCNRST
jgi:hypothetical protein